MRLVKSGFSLIAVAFMMAACTASVSAQATVILQNVKFPFTAEVFVPCGNNGAGEIVALAGTLHAVLQLSFDAAGGVHIKMHEQPQRVVGLRPNDRCDLSSPRRHSPTSKYQLVHVPEHPAADRPRASGQFSLHQLST
jgi:hypothetical protein